MRFPWQRKPHEDDTDLEGAQKAVESALADWPKVDAVAKKARQLRERNGFADAVNKAMGGPG